MKTPNLTLNILTFSHPQEEYTFYFTDKESPEICRIYHELAPQEVIEHFGQQEHYYTSFTENIDGFFPVTKKSKPDKITIIDEDGEENEVNDKTSAFSTSVLKRYYNSIIHSYFKQTGHLVKPNFISDTEIWLRNHKLSDSEYTYYEKFTIKVQFGIATNKPELLLTYAGKSKIFTKSVNELSSQVSADDLNWIKSNGSLIKYDDLSDEVRRNLQTVYPVWNFDIRDALHQPTEAPERGNRYIKYNKFVNGFYNKYLNVDAFKALIPIDCKGLIIVESRRIGSVHPASNQLLFGEGVISFSPIKGIQDGGPFALSTLKKVHFFFIYHKSDQTKFELMNSFFESGHYSFGGLYDLTKVSYFVDNDSNLVFENKNNPLPEIKEHVRKLDNDSNIQYIAIYISPLSKHHSAKKEKSVYYKVKEFLLKKDITSQVIDAAKINKSFNFVYSLNNMAIAILAKLNGIPWRIEAKLKNELIVGVGAYRHKDVDVQYIGSAFSFSNNGSFNRFECFRKSQVDELAGSIIRAIKEYVSINQNINRLIIHFFKNMSHEELEPIEDGLKNLGYDIPVFIISINKTESRDFVAFDNDWKQLMPESGTFINLGYNKYLLFNNTRYDLKTFRDNEGYPFPIKLSIYCTDKELARDTKIIKDLIDQVYQFSRIYWKSVKQQNLPVTIKYPEMVAEIFPYFDGNEIPEFGKDNLWFL